MWIQPNKG